MTSFIGVLYLCVKILYALCTWGLGHATRSLPVIRAMIREGHEIGIMSSGRTLELLKKELGEEVEYHDVPDYPAPYSGSRIGFYLRFGSALPKILKGIKREHEITEKILSKHGYERIVSDNRYGVYSKRVRSYLMTHQLRFIAPRRMKFIEDMAEKFVMKQGKGFERYIVPDDEEGTLSGELSHNLRYISEKKVLYAGPLSDFERKEISDGIDLLISISGPEPQRSIFERKIMEQMDDLPKNTVITLGKSEEYREYRKGNAVIYTYLPREKREEVMNRAKIVLSRSGYSTIMDLAILGKKAIFVPTPAQTEQEYLAEYHMEKGNYFSQSQENLEIGGALRESRWYKGIKMDARSVDRILEEVL